MTLYQILSYKQQLICRQTNWQQFLTQTPIPSLVITHHSLTPPIIHSQNFLKFSVNSYRITTRGGFIQEDDDDGEEICGFDDAVSLFNKRDYYKCHDVLEDLLNNSQEPTRTLVHGILQCAVGFHQLFNQNHKGAMMELGEGLCKLRKMNFDSGNHRMMFESSQNDASAVNGCFIPSQTSDPSPTSAKSRDNQPMYPALIEATPSADDKSSYLIDGVDVYNVSASFFPQFAKLINQFKHIHNKCGKSANIKK